MTNPLPSLMEPPVESAIEPFSQPWAVYFQGLHNRVGKDAPTATPDISGTVLMADNVGLVSTVVSSAPAAYNQVWGNEVVSLLEEIRDNQAAIIAAIKGSGVMNAT